MRALLLFALVIVAALGGVCRRRVSLSIDVSASVVAPQELKTSIKGALVDYLFRDAQSCLAIYAFGTAARRIVDFTGVATPADQRVLLDAVDGLVFETQHPNYYTNWEAGLRIILADRPSWVYLVTDGFPTTRIDCPDQPCDGEMAKNMRAAVEASRELLAAGVGVVGVGVGSGVSDEALMAISGPCVTTGCVKNWNYFHIESFTRLETPLGESFGQRLALRPQAAVDEVPITAEPSTTTTTTADPTTTTTATTTEEPTTTTTTVAPTTTTKRRTTRPKPTTTTTKRKILAHTRRPLARVTLAPTEVHSDAWVTAAVVGGIAVICLLCALFVACSAARSGASEPLIVYPATNDDEAPSPPSPPPPEAVQNYFRVPRLKKKTK
jgi:hypothetical protein